MVERKEAGTRLPVQPLPTDTGRSWAETVLRLSCHSSAGDSSGSSFQELLLPVHPLLVPHGPEASVGSGDLPAPVAVSWEALHPMLPLN